VGRESFHGTKELFNLPPLVLKARRLCVLLKLGVVTRSEKNRHICLTCIILWRNVRMPEQAVGWFSLLGLGLVVNLLNYNYTCINNGALWIMSL
jgi:hypothetical protein